MYIEGKLLFDLVKSLTNSCFPFQKMILFMLGCYRKTIKQPIFFFFYVYLETAKNCKSEHAINGELQGNQQNKREKEIVFYKGDGGQL